MPFHIPVMVEETIKYINPHNKGIYLDCTVGGGGHLKALIEKTTTAQFIGIDCDPAALQSSAENLQPYRARVKLVKGNFIHLKSILKNLDVDKVDGIIFDLGVSYYQLTNPQRGFGYDIDGRIDMRMDPELKLDGLTLIRQSNLEELTSILSRFGEVRNSRYIARGIYQNRNRIETTTDLRRIISRLVPGKYLKKTLSQVFQAFRIVVNNELENLKIGLTEASGALKKKDVWS